MPGLAGSGLKDTQNASMTDLVAFVSFSRNSQIVRASGTRSDRLNPRNRMNDRRGH
jgi:hypothetical protein